MSSSITNKDAAAPIKMSHSAVVINESNVNTGIIMRERKLVNNPNLWNKILVHCTEKLSRDVILKSILDDVHPLDLIPVSFNMEGLTASFFARNCRNAIEKLCAQNLVVANLQDKDKPLKLTIILAYSNTTDLVINVQHNISSVLNKRYQVTNRMLNLDSFYKDPDLNEFCALSQPKILYFVLHLSKAYQIQSLKLSNNDIHILSPMESLSGMKSLTTLDLRNNMIEKMSELNILKSVQITELFLDGNPVCDEYDEYSYIRAAREVCPKLEKLDGVILGQKGFLPFRRNYLCKLEAKDLVDHFMEHYFTLYDDQNRSLLSAMYAPDAMFSLTCQYLIGQSSSPSSDLSMYKRKSRNLRMISDLSKSNQNLVVGRGHIGKALQSLPPTEHDCYSFTVDLVFFSIKLLVVTITGSFREPAKSIADAEKMYGFTRTFVLKALSNNEYNITNDLLHISNATSAQQQRAFKIVRVPQATRFQVQIAKLPKEKTEMEEAFKLITTLNLEWSKKCLEECKYDLSKALVMFVDLYKVDKIPEIAFEE